MNFYGSTPTVSYRVVDPLSLNFEIDEIGI